MSLKTSHDNDHLDFGKIEQEVHTAVTDEEKYWRENSAKIRAVEQRVPTYDDFRGMVLAAHLKPLEKGDRISDMGVFTQVWNQAAQCENVSSDNSGALPATDRMNKTDVAVPKSGQEFVQAWRRLPKSLEDKKNFLLHISSDHIKRIFNTEISGGLLGEFLECLQTIDDSETATTLDILGAFSQSQRFSMSLAFLNKKEKAQGLSLFTKLKSKDALRDTSDFKGKIQALEIVYQF